MIVVCLVVFFVSSSRLVLSCLLRSSRVSPSLVESSPVLPCLVSSRLVLFYISDFIAFPPHAQVKRFRLLFVAVSTELPEVMCNGFAAKDNPISGSSLRTFSPHRAPWIGQHLFNPENVKTGN